MIIRTLLLSVIAFRLSAQQFSPAPFLGAGGAAIAQEGIFALHDNPAGLTSLNRFAVGSAYQQHFVGTGIATQALYLATPFARSAWIGFNVVNYGIFNVSSLMRSGASFVRAFGEQFSASISLNYHQFAVQFYESQRQYSGDLGFQYQVVTKLKLGLFWRNISNSSFSTSVDQRLPQELGVGALLHVTNELQAAADIWRDHTAQWQYRTGLTYRFGYQFCIQGGLTSNPLRYTAGIGFGSGKWQVNIASTFHVALGSSPQLALCYAF